MDAVHRVARDLLASTAVDGAGAAAAAERFRPLLERMNAATDLGEHAAIAAAFFHVLVQDADLLCANPLLTQVVEERVMVTVHTDTSGFPRPAIDFLWAEMARVAARFEPLARLREDLRCVRVLTAASRVDFVGPDSDGVTEAMSVCPSCSAFFRWIPRRGQPDAHSFSVYADGAFLASGELEPRPETHFCGSLLGCS
jgi:hypothetical protein